MLRRILIGDNERVLVIRKRRFAEILEPGERWMFTLGQGVELERYNVRDLVYSGEWQTISPTRTREPLLATSK
jgi:hypothetical protein